jgi:hypothetical protein
MDPFTSGILGALGGKVVEKVTKSVTCEACKKDVNKSFGQWVTRPCGCVLCLGCTQAATARAIQNGTPNYCPVCKAPYPS